MTPSQKVRRQKAVRAAGRKAAVGRGVSAQPTARKPLTPKPLTKKQLDAAECTKGACERVGLYAGLQLNLEEFLKRPCADLVTACGKKCPLDPGDYGQCLLSFQESLRACLEGRGYSKMTIRLQDLCASLQENGSSRPYTWLDWCKDLALTLVKRPTAKRG